MNLFCIWGETRADVLAGYEAVAEMEEPPQRVTWRLAAAFTGKPVGSACHAPNHPDIRAAYGVEVIPQDEADEVSDVPDEAEEPVDLIPQDEEVAVQDDDDLDD